MVAMPTQHLFSTLITKVNSLQQIRMAEIEQASLKSEQLSDKSSSPALPDDLSLDEHTTNQLLNKEGKVSMSRAGLKKDISTDKAPLYEKMSNP